MDIIKSILHVFKKSDNAFKIMHPETESAQVTDWHQGIVNTLANTGLSSLVNVLSSDSLLALLIKKVFDATGVKYSLGQNGYVCFGSFYGGLIIQWGKANTTALKYSESFPLAYSHFVHVIPYDITGTSGSAFTAAVLSTTNNRFTVTTDSANKALGAFGWISIGV